MYHGIGDASAVEPRKRPKYDTRARLLTFEPEIVRKPAKPRAFPSRAPAKKQGADPCVTILTVSRDECTAFFSPNVPKPLVTVCTSCIHVGQKMSYCAARTTEKKALSLYNKCRQGTILVYTLYNICQVSPVVVAAGIIQKAEVEGTCVKIEWEITAVFGTRYTQSVIENMDTWVPHKKDVKKYTKPGLWHVPRFMGICRDLASGSLSLDQHPEKSFIASVWKILSMNSFSVPLFSLEREPGKYCLSGNQ